MMQSLSMSWHGKLTCICIVMFGASFCQRLDLMAIVRRSIQACRTDLKLQSYLLNSVGKGVSAQCSVRNMCHLHPDLDTLCAYLQSMKDLSCGCTYVFRSGLLSHSHSHDTALRTAEQLHLTPGQQLAKHHMLGHHPAANLGSRLRGRRSIHHGPDRITPAPGTGVPTPPAAHSLRQGRGKLSASVRHSLPKAHVPASNPHQPQRQHPRSATCPPPTPSQPSSSAKRTCKL